MLFNSYEFIFLFLPITCVIYFYLNKKQLSEFSKIFLVLSSLFFYGWWNVNYIPLLLISMLFNYAIGKSLINDKKHKVVSKKQLLTIGIIGNIGLLVYFKYLDFFISNINFVVGSNIPLLHLALPLAISFFTFQQIAYLVDLYRGNIKEYNLLNYGLFLTFFPQLIAGPIVHHKEVIFQFTNKRNKIINYKNVSLGLFIFSIGLFKKVVLADTFAVWANMGYDEAEVLTFFEAWATSLSYAFQIYFDFSGYSDMAIGLALIFNIKLPINFNSPYKATSIINLWQRWHITLSRFITKYVFEPLLKSFGKYTFYKALIAVFLSMLVSGLWHGSSFMFIIFGAINGLAIVINHIWKKMVRIKLNKYIGWILTFNTFILSTIFFRAKEFDDAIKILKGMSGQKGIILPNSLLVLFPQLQEYNFIIYKNMFENISGDRYMVLSILLGFIITLLFNNSTQLKNNFKFDYKSLIFCIIVFMSSVLALNRASNFIYYNF